MLTLQNKGCRGKLSHKRRCESLWNRARWEWWGREGREHLHTESVRGLSPLCPVLFSCCHVFKHLVSLCLFLCPTPHLNDLETSSEKLKYFLLPLLSATSLSTSLSCSSLNIIWSCKIFYLYVLISFPMKLAWLELYLFCIIMPRRLPKDEPEPNEEQNLEKHYSGIGESQGDPKIWSGPVATQEQFSCIYIVLNLTINSYLSSAKC